MVSLFVAQTRQEAHAVARENWRDTDTADGLAYMKSLGIDPSQPDFATGSVGWMTWNFDQATPSVSMMNRRRVWIAYSACKSSFPPCISAFWSLTVEGEFRVPGCGHPCGYLPTR